MVILKKFFQIIGLCSFIVISFFYTDKVMHVVREEDKIMINIRNVRDTLRVEPIDAIIDKDMIIPGINGKDVDVEKSYKIMKNNGIFRENDIVYHILQPSVSINNHKDKYVISGNASKRAVSFIFILDDVRYLDKLRKLLDYKDVIGNYFVDYNFLISNSTLIKEMSQCEIYYYGNNGKYTPDSLLFANNLISGISNNHSNLCLVLKKDKNTIDLCNKNSLYTILPGIIVGKSPYMELKNRVKYGDMILFYLNQDTINELSIVIDYIRGKGIKIVGLSELLSEKNA